MTELKRCPFCGSKVILFDNHNDFSAKEKEYGIQCTNRKCGMYMTFVYKRTQKSRLIDAWNKRKGGEE